MAQSYQLMFSPWLPLRRQEIASSDNTIPFGQCEGEEGLREPGEGGGEGELARLVYVDDKQGCTNVSGNSTNRNG